MITTTYKSRDYRPEDVMKRYVRRSVTGCYHFCETNAKGYDIHQGIVTADELPPDVGSKADHYKGEAFNYVEWHKS